MEFRKEGMAGDIFQRDIAFDMPVYELLCRDHLPDLGGIGEMLLFYFYDLRMIIGNHDGTMGPKFNNPRRIHLFKIALFEDGRKKIKGGRKLSAKGRWR
jgi:hypothetical protein